MGESKMSINELFEDYPAQSITVVVCLVISFVAATIEIIRHRKDMTTPTIQRRLCWIILSYPLMLLFTALTIAFNEYPLIFSVARTVVETFSVYVFLNLFLVYLTYDPQTGGENREGFYQYLLTRKLCVTHLFGCDCKCRTVEFKSVEGIAAWIRRVKFYALQTVIIKPIIESVLFYLQVRGEDTRARNFLCRLPMMMSVFLSVYQLLFIFKNFRGELAYSSPKMKFVAIKIVIILEVIQTNVINSSTGEEFEIGHQNALENFILVIELLLIGLMANYAFGYGNFKATVLKLKEPSFVPFLDDSRVNMELSEDECSTDSGIRSNGEPKKSTQEM
mmetsp:Transcript_25104/g.28690  ORF Transcript_25104/g.28690 Transcript_25104/m.28690 type:complete len:334 (-) Transcript_25104:1552-2553(-)